MRITNKELIEAVSDKYNIEEEEIRKVLKAVREYIFDFLVDIDENEVNETYPFTGIKLSSMILEHNKRNKTITVKASLTEKCRKRFNKEIRRINPNF